MPKALLSPHPKISRITSLVILTLSLFAVAPVYAQRTGSTTTVSEDSVQTAVVGYAKTATVLTDLEEYPPGTVVTIIGDGFQSGETIALSINYVDSTILVTGTPYTIEAVANDFGQFEAYWVLPLDGSVGDTLEVHGSGVSSGKSARSKFRTSNTILTLDFLSSDSLCPTGAEGALDSFTVRANLSQFCSANATSAALEGREILFFLNQGDCGVKIGQNSQDSAQTDAAGYAYVTFAIPAVQGKYSVRVKYRGEDKPKPCPEIGNSACNLNATGSKRCVELSNSNDCRGLVVMQDACDRPPTISCPNDTTITICPGAEVCVSPLTTDAPAGAIVSVSVDFGAIRGDSVCFTPDSSGFYTITATVTDQNGESDTCVTVVAVTLNGAPEIIVNNSSVNACFSGAQITHDVNAADPDNDVLTWSLESGFGSVDQNGLITFTADTSGTYCFDLRVDDGCSFDQKTVCVTVILDNLPKINGFSDTLNACPGDTICFTVNGSDPDFGDTIQITQLSGFGSFSMNSDSSGVTCFVIGELDTVTTYEFRYQVTDNCLRDSTALNSPAPPEAVVSITVIAPVSISVNLPDDFTVFQCDPDTVCVSLELVDPDGALKALNTNFGVYNSTSSEVCYLSDGTGSDTLIVTAIDNCGRATADTVIITIETAEPFVVNCPADTALFVCDSTDICVPFGFFPAGVEVSVSPASATYDHLTGEICFFTNCSVRKEITVTVSDDCQSESCTFVVDVTMNSAPFLVTQSALSVELCGPEIVCWSVGIIDDDLNLAEINITPAEANYDSITGKICLPVDTSGVYEVITAVTDECGAVGTDTTILTVHVNSTPEVSAGIDLNIELCVPQELCVTFGVSDPDGEQLTIVPNIGQYNSVSRLICFTPDTAGTYSIIGTATDQCGATASDTAFVTVRYNEAPQIILGSDTTITLCNVSEICLPVIIPNIFGNSNLESVIPSGGYYNPNTQEICFTPSGPGQIEIVVTATDACGVSAVDTILVDVVINETVTIACPTAPLDINVCGEDSLFYPLEISPSNAVVMVSGGVYENGVLKIAVDTSGKYVVDVIASADCGTDSCRIIFNVDLGQPISLNCPIDTSVFLCNAGDTVTIPVGLVVDQSAVTVTPLGYYQDGSILFTPDTAGVYMFTVSVNNACGESSCSFTVNVALNSAPEISVSDTALFLCDIKPIALTINASDPDNNLLSINADHGTIVGNTLNFTPPGAGTFEVILTATDSCGEVALDTATITVSLNTAPELALGADTALALCQVETLCFPLDVSDTDSNIETITVIGADYDGNVICFTPPDAGLFIIVATVTDSCGLSDSDTLYIDLTLNTPPAVALGASLDTALCAPQEICVSATVFDDNLFSVVAQGGELRDGSICFTPDSSDVYLIILSATDSCGVTVSDTTTVTVALNLPPVVMSAPDTSITICLAGTVCFAVDVSDVDNNLVSIVSSGARNALYQNGQLCFDPDSAGIYTLITTATDSCSLVGADTTVVTVLDNSPPNATFATDTLILQCVTDSICLPVDISDPDNDIAEVSVTGASYNETTGEICFLPTTNGEILITLTVVDSCGLSTVDSLIVFANLGEEFTLVCPADTQMFICEPDTLCFPLPGVPAGADIVVTPASVWYDDSTGAICFYTNCSVEKKIKIVVTDGCFVDSCDFVATVTMNTPPLVIIQPDTAALLCGPQDICLKVGISDADYNISSVQVAPLGSYNPVTGLACIPIDTGGIYQIIISVVDSCGARGVDSVYINARVNSPPQVISAPDTTVFLCAAEEICIPVSVSDPDQNILFAGTSHGSYNGITGEVCFTPSDSGGSYVIITAVVDSCGLRDDDTTIVSVVINSAPVIVLQSDTTLNLCVSTEVCVPLDVSDIDGNLLSVSAGAGVTYDPLTGTICFVAASSSQFQITVTATDSCGAVTQATVTVDVTLNSAPVVVAGADTTVSGCGLREVCFPVGISDADYNLASVVVVPSGSYDPISGLVCVTPIDTGMMAVIIIATDSCGAVGADTTWVISSIEPDALIPCPTEPISVFLCGPDTVRQALDIQPLDAIVNVSFGNYVNRQLVFYADTAGTYIIDITAQGGCGADSCQLTFVVSQGQTPKFTCPADTTMFLCEPTQACRPVGILPDGAQVTITPAGSYSAGMICFSADTSGKYEIFATAVTECGTDTCSFIVDVVINSAPVVSGPADTSLLVCNLGSVEICRPTLVSDIDFNLLSVSVPSFARIDDSGQVCFTPDTPGVYTLFIEARDSCGAVAVDTFLVEIITVAPALIACQDTLTFEFCEEIERCFPLNISPAGASVSAVGGTLIGSDSLCFFFDTSGLYTSTIIAETECGADTCELVISATLLPKPTITCPEDTIVSLCAPDTLCLPFDHSPANAFLSVSAPAYISGDTVCIPLISDTTLTIELKAAVSCGVAICTFTVTVDINEAPSIDLGPDFDFLRCSFDTICIPVTLADPENSIERVTSNFGVFDPAKQAICFAPSTVGHFTVIGTVFDSCGAIGVDTVIVEVYSGVQASITCPQGIQQASLCSADSVCLLIPITAGVDSVVTSIGVYNPPGKELCFFADTTGVYTIDMIAYAPCGNDTCQVTVDVTITPVPTLACPEPFDTTVCVSQFDSLCINIGSVSSGAVVTVNPIGVYSAGNVCVPVDTPGVYQIEVIASTICGVDSCLIEFTVNDNNAPDLIVPSGSSATYCEDFLTDICITGIVFSDSEGDPLTITQLCGPGSLSLISDDSAMICFKPSSPDSVYEFCVQVSDGCHTRTESFFVTITPSPNCGLATISSIVGPECTPVGQDALVRINSEVFTPIGGLDLLISYDASAVAFLFADPGASLADWEYFTYNVGPFISCGVACPNGLVRLVALADINNGEPHPPVSAFTPQGELVRLMFRISPDQNLGDQFIPVNFYWLDCGDNSFSDPTGEVLYLDSRIFNAQGNLIWDESDDETYPESARVPGLGASDDPCLSATATVQPVRAADFYNGGICIIPQDANNNRGDINLNGLSYEIADAVTFTNYFIIGLSAFKIDVALQVAATDVNADGQTLTIADLVFLIRVLIGDENPIPKIVPSGVSAEVTLARDAHGFVIRADLSQAMGAAYFTFEYEGAPPRTLKLADEFAGMELNYTIKNGKIRALISENAESASGAALPAGKNINLLRIELPEDYAGELRLIGAELSDSQGWQVINARTLNVALPISFELSQNYPNPFNPATEIQLALPLRSAWELTIYNMLGQSVRRFTGESDAGVTQIIWDGKNESGKAVASGVYLYRAKAGQFSKTRKMLLLK